MKSILSFMMLCLFMCFSISAQSDRYQMYVVHEDHVKNDMMNKHIEADKAILKAAKEHNMKGMDWLTFQTEDNRVMYLTPIKNFAELDKNPFQDLKQKMGDASFEKLFEPYAETYTKHGDYILRLDNELSYMPDGMSQTPEGGNYRELTFYHIPPGKDKEAEDLAKSVKKLYKEKGAKVHYRVYKSGFGTMGNYYMVAVSGKDAASIETQRNENMQLLGDEGQSLFQKIEKLTAKQEVVKGNIKPELSYSTSN